MSNELIKENELTKSNELTKANELTTKEFMLTTNDNPFDPFEQFASWLLFDKEKGYNSCEKIATLAHITDDMTQKEIDEETNRVIEKIIELDFLDIYTKAYKKV